MQLRRSGILVGRFLILMFVCASLPRLTIALEPQPSKNETRVKPGVRSDGYGDPLPPGTLARMGTVRDFIGEGSSRIIFSPGGQFVTASSAFISPKLRLWDPANGRVVREFTELYHLGIGAGYVAFSPDGKQIAAANYEVVWLGTTDTGYMIRVFPGHEYIEGIAFSPDSTVLVVKNAGAVWFWDIASGARTRWPSLAGYRPFTFTYFFEVVGWRRLGSALSLRFGVSGREIGSARQQGYNRDIPFPVAMSRDRQVMASNSRDNTIRLWNVTTGRPMRSLLRYRVPPGLIIENMEHQVEFSPDGKLVAAGDTLTSLSLWDVDTGSLYRRFHGVEIEMGFAFAPDGKRVVTGGRYFRYWDIARGQEIHRYPQRAAVVAVAFTPDGKNLATADGLKLRLWDAATGREIPRFQGQHEFRKLLYPMDHAGREDRSLGGRRPVISAMAISPDGKTLVSGADDGSLWLWDLSTGREIRQVQGRKGSIQSVAFAPKGKTFAAADERGIGLVDSSSGTEIIHFPGPAESFIRRISFSPDVITLASAHDRVVALEPAN